jgi:hypothetical protein
LESMPIPEIIAPRQLARLASSTPMPDNIITPRRSARSSIAEVPLIQERSHLFDENVEEETQVQGGVEGEESGGGAAHPDADMYGSAADHAGPSGTAGAEADIGSRGFEGEDSGTDGIPSDAEDADVGSDGGDDADSDVIEVI